MKILNLPDLNAPAADNNYCVIQKLSPNSEIISNVHNYTYLSPIDVFNSYCAEENLDLIVGNGFGAFLAYVLGAELKVKTVLTNPHIPAHDYTHIELFQYEDWLKELWEKYKFKNTDCHILLSVTEHNADSTKVYELLKDAADIKLLCNTISIFTAQSYEQWLYSYLR